MSRLLTIPCILLSIIIIQSCEDKPVPPSLSETTVTEISATTAVSGGTITSNGGATVTLRGVCWNTSDDPTTGNSKIIVNGDLLSFTGNITQLSPNTSYYVRAFATNIAGTGYGKSVSFKTLGAIPSVITEHAQNVKITSATLEASVNPNYLPTDFFFEFGTSTSYGHLIPASQYPFSGGEFIGTSCLFTDLTAETTYHYRIIAENEFGKSIGEDVTFTTYSIADIDNNFYHSVNIGTQTWMKENLKTTKYANGDLVGTTFPATLDISTESDPKYQWAYSGDENNVATYGRLYTWYAVTDSRNICPTGWHLPTDGEFVILITTLGGESIAGGKLKETGTTHWYSTSSNVNNESGFTALPAGSRFYNQNIFDGISFAGWWWSSTPNDFNLNNAWVIYVGNSEINLHNGDWQKKNGYSVRCIKN